MAIDSLNAIAYSILNSLRPHLSDDSDIDLREIKREVRKTRSLLLRNEYNKNNRSIDDDVIQNLGCVELELTDAADCCDIQSGCTVVRTVLEIPDTIELHQRTAITRVGPVNKMSKSYLFIDYDRVPFFGNSRFNGKEVACFLHSDRIYLVSKDDSIKFMKYINIRGVFEDVEAVAKFKHCTGEACYTDDDKYFLTDWMEVYLKEMVTNKFLIKLGQPVDNTNDNKDNTVKEGV
jgi:hypothetical protein